MNTKDLHYYNSLNAFYDWEKHMINVGCKSKDLNFLDPSKSITEEGDKNVSVFVHEYIHYLQNFTTTWGSLIFKDFTFALIRIGASSSDKSFRKNKMLAICQRRRTSYTRNMPNSTLN